MKTLLARLTSSRLRSLVTTASCGEARQSANGATAARYMFVVFTLVGALPTFAQSPNTAALVVTVVDQTGGAVPGAQVSVRNSATGATRDVISGAEGSATITALSLTGEYRVSVAMSGFTAEDITGLTLRAGETATVKVKLVATGGTS